MTDYEEEQRNELEALEAIYATEFKCECREDFVSVRSYLVYITSDHPEAFLVITRHL